MGYFIIFTDKLLAWEAAFFLFCREVNITYYKGI